MKFYMKLKKIILNVGMLYILFVVSILCIIIYVLLFMYCYLCIIYSYDIQLNELCSKGDIFRIYNYICFLNQTNICIPIRDLSASISGHVALKLLRIDPQLCFGVNCSFFVMIDSIASAFKLTVLWRSRESLDFWNYLAHIDPILYNKLHYLFEIDDTNPRFFLSIFHQRHTYDNWLLLLDLSEYILKFYKLYIQKFVVGNVIYWREGNFWFVDI